MQPDPVIDRQVTWEPAVPLLQVLGGGHNVGPFRQQGLDKSLGFAVCSGCVGLGADELQMQGFAGVPPCTSAIRGAVIGEGTAVGDALCAMCTFSWPVPREQP